MSADPMGGDINDPQSLNRYAYVGNDASDYSDPSGMLRYPCLSSPGSCGWGPGFGGSGSNSAYGGAGYIYGLGYSWLGTAYGPDMVPIGDYYALGFIPIGIISWTSSGSGGGSKCTINIRVKNKVGLTNLQVVAVESQIAAIFSAAVNVNFNSSSGPYFSLNLVSAAFRSHGDGDFGRRTTRGGLYEPHPGFTGIVWI